ncbi:hypothetical protein [Microcoleus sp. FACHB-672]|nr:hypothetical protein [Microcoleus sp. FACHB-672]
MLPILILLAVVCQIAARVLAQCLGTLALVDAGKAKWCDLSRRFS